MKNEEIDTLIGKRLSKAKESYKIAEDIYKAHPTFSVNRYYYSLYYAVSALLLSEDIETKTHKGVISEFNRLMVRSGNFSKEEGRLLTKVFQWRTKGDYDDDEDYTVEDVETIRVPVKLLLNKICGILEK